VCVTDVVRTSCPWHIDLRSNDRGRALPSIEGRASPKMQQQALAHIAQTNALRPCRRSAATVLLTQAQSLVHHCA